MLDPQFIRDNPEKVQVNMRDRGFAQQVIDTWLSADKTRRQHRTQLDELNRQRNEIAEKLQDAAQRTPEVIEQGKLLKQQADALETEFKEADQKWNELLMQIPNMTDEKVPQPQPGEDQFVEVRKWGELPKFDFAPKDHLELATNLNMVDFEAGSKVAGSQFYYLKNDAVLLEMALIQLGFKVLQEYGFELVITPDLAKSRYYLGTGYLPRGDEAQIYEIEGEDLGLIGSAEITMAGYHADEIFAPEDLPKKYAAVSHCFRKEAGAYGKYSKGLYRVHQFTKLEMFVYCTPEESEKHHMMLLEIEEKMLQLLGIPYRVIEFAPRELGAMAARKFDLEAWLPGRNDWGEVTSTSNCTDFQARNLNIRYKAETGNEYAHMLNGTAVVMSRFPIAILENYQQADGTVKVPEALVPYMGKSVIGG